MGWDRSSFVVCGVASQGVVDRLKLVIANAPAPGLHIVCGSWARRSRAMYRRCSLVGDTAVFGVSTSILVTANREGKL